MNNFNDKPNNPSVPFDVTDIKRITKAIESRINRMNTDKTGNLYDKHDLVQEVWIRLLSDDSDMLQKYDAERGATLEYYISMITKREAHNILRKEKSQRRSGQERVEPPENNMDGLIGITPEPMLEARDLMNRLNVWLRKKRLSGKGLDVCVSTIILDDPADIASRLGISTQCIYNWQHKIRLLSRSFRDRNESASDVCPSHGAATQDYSSRDSSIPGI